MRIEGAAHFHARENTADPVLIPPLRTFQMRPHAIFLANTLLLPDHGNLVIPGVAFRPVAVLLNAPASTSGVIGY